MAKAGPRFWSRYEYCYHFISPEFVLLVGMWRRVCVQPVRGEGVVDSLVFSRVIDGAYTNGLSSCNDGRTSVVRRMDSLPPLLCRFVGAVKYVHVLEVVALLIAITSYRSGPKRVCVPPTHRGTIEERIEF